jgi:succinate dehydrogenase / fumarate reductase flavoprotein subunit
MLGTDPVPVDDPAFKQVESEVRASTDRFLSIGGTKSVDHFHRELGKIMWDNCGMERSQASLEKAIAEIPALEAEFWKDLRVLGTGDGLNQTLEKAGRVADFFELGLLLCKDALAREESCGGHFRAEHQTEDGEAERDDEHFAHVAAWEWTGDPTKPERNVEPLIFDNVHLAVRSYK